MTQFDGLKFRSVTVPFIDSLDKARETVNRINLTAEVEGARPIVFATLIEDDVRAILSESKGLFLDFFDAFIGPLERELEVRSTHTVGKAHGVANTTAYARRIDAMNFALENDDGANTRNYNRADVILTGVSRSGKTPTCLYLALHYGIFPANYPLAEEEFETGKLPETLEKFRDKLYGLTISSDRLQQVRGERRRTGCEGGDPFRAAIGRGPFPQERNTVPGYHRMLHRGDCQYDSSPQGSAGP